MTRRPWRDAPITWRMFLEYLTIGAILSLAVIVFPFLIT